MGKAALAGSGAFFSFYQDYVLNLWEPILYVFFLGIVCYIGVIVSVYFDYTEDERAAEKAHKEKNNIAEKTVMESLRG